MIQLLSFNAAWETWERLVIFRSMSHEVRAEVTASSPFPTHLYPTPSLQVGAVTEPTLIFLSLSLPQDFPFVLAPLPARGENSQ